MNEEIIENEKAEEAPKPKRTRRKPKPEPVEVEQVENVEPVEVEEVQETTEKAPEIDSKAVSEPELVGYLARVKTALLNVRERPSKASKAYDGDGYPLKHNTVVQVLSEVNGWGMIAPDHYVMLDFIERIDD